MITRLENPASAEFLRAFDAIWNDTDKLTDVTEEVIEMISAVYQENSPELVYFMALYNIFSEFLEDISEDVLPNEATGFKNSTIWNKLFNFQKDAALAIINKLEQYNGCILADSVGLGKTFTALAVIKYHEGRNKNVLVLCPKKRSDNWMTYRENYINNPLAKDRFGYNVAYHTDLSRESGKTATGAAIDRINWGNYDLVVIDESHNFRNGNGTGNSDKENRYTRLLNRIIKPGVKTKVLMLSATPVDNRFYDLRNQLALAYEGDPTEFNEKLATKSDIDTIFRQAQKVYNAWCKLPAEERTTANLLSRLDFGFFEILDSVTIARSRKHIQTYYDTTDIGTFPARNAPISLNPKLTDLEGAINYREVFESLENLLLTIYTPTIHIHASKLHKYLDSKETEEFRKGRECGVKRLMSINLLKRMESSVHSFLLTVRRIYDYLLSTTQTIEQFMADGTGDLEEIQDLSGAAADFDYDDQNTDFFSVGKKIKIDLRDMDYISWKREIDADIETLQLLIAMVEDITPEYDFKLRELTRVIREKVAAPINPGNKKILIFTAFADTAECLYENISRMAQAELGLHTALITGSVDGRTTIPRFKADMNSGVSIMDLGLNEFRMNLLAYRKEHGDIEHTPFGIHAAVKGEKPGVIFILKNMNEDINIERQNRLHPFYMVYVGMDGEVITNHLQPKDTLDVMRHLARGRSAPDKDLCGRFNRATDNGRNMGKVSRLLEDAILSIIDAKDEGDIDSFFSSGQTTFLSGGFSGLDDFELICFMVVM